MSAAKIRLIAIATVTVALFTVMSVIADFPLVDAMWAAGAEDIYRTVSDLSAEQRRAYRIMLVVDFAYAAAYAGLLLETLRFFRSSQRFRRVLCDGGKTVALAAGTLDYLENAGILIVLAALPDRSPVAAGLGTVTTLKWVAVFAAGTALAVVAFTAFVNRIGHRKNG